MAITSLDIQNQSFSIDRKGYDVDEVDVFLEHVANEIDALNAQVMNLTMQLDDARMAGFDEPAAVDFIEDEVVEEVAPIEADVEEAAPAADPAVIADLKAKIADLEAQLDEKNSNDSAISQALIVAQRSADALVSDAKNEASQIVADADDEAARILTKAESDRQKVQDAIQALEEEREQVRVNYRDMLNDFVDDAERKLTAIDADARKSAQAAHAQKAAAQPAAPVSSSVANYQVPTNIGGAQKAAAPAQSNFFEKDFSGFGDVEADFDFTDPD